MRAVNEQKLQLLLFHELRRRLAALTLEDERLTEKMAVELLIETLHQIPGLHASMDSQMQLCIQTPSGMQSIPVQNIIDGLCLLWNEFRERQDTATD